MRTTVLKVAISVIVPEAKWIDLENSEDRGEKGDLHSPWNYQGLSPAENFNINSIGSEGHQHKDNIPFIHRYFVIVAIARLKASPYMTLAGPHSFSQGVLGTSRKELAVYTEIFCLPASPWARLSPYQLESCQEPQGDLT